MPLLPFPQRFAKSELDSQFVKFIDVHKKLNVNAPFIDVMSQMPMYAKFLKDILFERGRLMSMRPLH